MDMNFYKILQCILGKEDFDKMITKATHEYNEDNKYDLTDFENIQASYIIVILLIGFSKKKVEIEKYSIHLVNKPDISIDVKKFCKKYKEYIDKVEEYKFELLRKLI